MKERSAFLESKGRLATEETREVREQLEGAEGELEAARGKGRVLEARLGTLEEECLEAQNAQELLRSVFTYSFMVNIYIIIYYYIYI